MRSFLPVILFLALFTTGARTAMPEPPANRVHDPENLLAAAQVPALAEKLTAAAENGADLWVVTSSSDRREDIQSLAVSLQAAWGRGPVNAVLVFAPAVRPQPFVHAGGAEAHLFDSGDLQEQLNGALQRALALRPEDPLLAGVDALATEFAILNRRLARLRERNLAALAIAAAGEEKPAQLLPRWADSIVIPVVAGAIALTSLAALGLAITRQTRGNRQRHFPTAAFQPRLDAPFSGGSDFTRDLPRRQP